MKIIVCGDIHCDWSSLNVMINRQKPDIILQCGDWGWWPHFHDLKLGLPTKPFDQFGVKNHKTKIFWCPGNHENWDDIDSHGPDIFEVQKDIFCCPFGTTLDLPTGERVLFVGGADSIDKDSRIEGHSWWRQEIITQREMYNLPDVEIDIVVSHTVPSVFTKAFEDLFPFSINFKSNDPSCLALDIVLEKYQPKKWFSGHFHKYMNANYNGCEWIGLDMTFNYGRWWIVLK